jgi:nucleotide-binding universal stress UspA family protein
MTQSFTPPSIVVGVDGSRAAVRAAQWAVDEAVGRGLALRLVAAAEPGTDPAASEAAVRAAAAAVESSGRTELPQVTTEVITGAPLAVLLEAARTAAMICVGAVGLRHFERGRVGSTAGALVGAAHCPVAVVRGTATSSRWVVAELDQTPESAAVLQFAVEEARLRRCPLRVLGTWQSGDHDTHSAAETDRVVRANLDRRLETWKHRFPDLDVEPVAVRGGGLGYLTDNAASIQLVVIGARNTAGLGELFGPAGLAALHDTDFSVLVVDPQRLL